MKKTLFYTLLLLCMALPVGAQHLKKGHINPGTSGADFRISDWVEGSEWSEDDNFYISRVKPKARFINQSTQINQEFIPWWEWDYNASYDRNKDYSHYSKKILNWIPYGFSYTYDELSPFEILPNGIFNSEVFSMWQYISTWGTWSDHFMRMPGNFADVAHKNGVAVATQSTTAYGADMTTNGWGDAYVELGGSEESRNKVLAYLDYYGIDGIGYNSEFAGGYDAHGVKEIVKLNEAIAKHFSEKYTGEMKSFSAENIWYDGVTVAGSPRFDSGVSELTEVFFGSAENKTSSFFLNYNWNANYTNNNNEYLPPTLQYAAEKLKRNPFDVYASVNLQGHEPKLTGKGEENGRWQYLTEKAVSLGIWSGHDCNAFWEDRYDQGSTPMQIQHTYQKLLEHWFTNSYYNPIYAIDNNLVVNESLINTLDTEFFGMSKFVAAQSTLSWDLSQEAFVSYFNMGNGTFFNWQGVRQHNAEWFNIGIQDYLPTWRWWWSKKALGRSTQDIPTGMTALLDWNDAWFGGSSLRITGSEQGSSILHLFKTQYNVQSGDIVTVRYKLNKGNAQCTLLLGMGKECNEWNSDTPYVVLDTDNTVYGTWIEKQFVVSMSNELALIALQFDDAENLDINIGEISIKRGTYATPDVPSIIRSKILACHAKGIDAKVIFDMNTATGNKKGHYNIDHNVAFYNIYAKVNYGEGYSETTLMGSTTSWAAAFFSAPLNAMGVLQFGANLQIGVQAVGVDMTTTSEIAWSDAMEIVLDGEQSIYELNNDIVISSSYITDGTTFTIGYSDPLHPAAQEWSITGPFHNSLIEQPTTIVVAKETPLFGAQASVASTSVELGALPAGYYDVHVTETDGTKRTLTSIIHVYDHTAIVAPQIEKFVALDTDGDNESISAVSDATAGELIMSDYKDDFVMVAEDGSESNYKENAVNLPGAGIKLQGKDQLRMHYVANANAQARVSKAVDLRQQSLSIVAKDAGIIQHRETEVSGSGWESVTTTHSNLNFSIAFWIKVSNIDYKAWLLSIRNDKDAWPNSLWGWLWHELDHKGNMNAMTIRSANDNAYIYNYSENGNSNFQFEKDVWYHFAYVFKESKIYEIDYYGEYFDAQNEYTLYINGVPLDTVSSSLPKNIGWSDFDSDATIALGGIAGKGRFAGFDAAVDNFQLYNIALDEAGVLQSMGQFEDPNKVEGLVGFWDFEDENNNGYANGVSAYPNARLQHYYVSSLGNTVIPELHETAGYLGFTAYDGYTLAPEATYSVNGGVTATISADNSTHNFNEVAGEHTMKPTYTQATVAQDDKLYGYADLNFPNPGLNRYKIYTVKLQLDNGIGSDEAEYKYVYVANIEGRIQANIVGTEAECYIKNIYPNPFDDHFYVQADKAGTYNIILLDMEGHEVMHRQADLQAGETIELKVNVTPGVYIAIVTRGNEVVASTKIVKK
ncbi:MAG: T9SS type A sorting domain-containing protein [Bacteroidaceae bacterium]|nr:T9SS type A sorting domain-containing protein [Bacteroidaceae bacterium]